MDDIAGSKSNLTEAKKITKEIDTILGKGQFQIKVWHSNCSEIDQSSGERFTDLLGHKWDKEEDKSTFKKKNMVGLLEGFSKRSCLKFLAQLWDPIELVSPVLTKFGNIQQTWLGNVQSINYLLQFQFDHKLNQAMQWKCLKFMDSLMVVNRLMVQSSSYGGRLLAKTIIVFQS